MQVKSGVIFSTGMFASYSCFAIFRPHAFRNAATLVKGLTANGICAEYSLSIHKGFLEYLGHVMRKESLENLTLTGRIDGKKSRGIPR